MTQLKIEKLDAVKLPLVQKLYKEHYPSGKAKSHELIYVSYSAHQLCGVVRIRPMDRWRLLTGMLVKPEYRNKGVGHAIMAFCETGILNNNDYCFAYSHLEAFYSQHGFQTIAAEALPEQLRILFERYSRSGKLLIPMKFSFK